MKKIKLLIIVFVVLGFSSCTEKEFNLWSDSDVRLAFKFDTKLDSISTYTFVYENSSVVRDTVYFTLYTSGFTRDVDKSFELEQLEPKSDTSTKAIPGVHFVKFDDPEVSKHFVIKAGEVKVEIPIIVLRDESLLKTSVELRMRIKENENFIGGVESDLEKRLVFSDILGRPDGYSKVIATDAYMGPYSVEKHRFMIEFAPENCIINDAFFISIYGPGTDLALLPYYSGYFKQKLIDDNKKRVSNGLDVWREAPKDGQTIGDAIYFKK